EDDRGGNERHQFPACEERERVAGAQHLREDEDEEAGERGRDPAASRPLDIARSEPERRRGDEAERAEEERRQPVDTEVRGERTGEPGAERPPARERPEAENAERRGGERLDPRCHSDSSSRKSDCW